MKISTILTTAAIALSAMTANAFVISDVTHLYLIGSATDGGWTQEESEELTNEGDGIYTISTNLTKGDFKFILGRDTWDSLVSKDGEDYKVVLDTPMAVGCNGNNGDTADNKWVITEAGLYKLTVNINDATLTVNKLGRYVIKNLFIVGDASPSGWNLGDAPRFNKSGNTFQWIGRLGVGQFKLTTTNKSFAAMVSADGDNTGVTYGEAMQMEYYDGDKESTNDYKWYNNESGVYTLTVDAEKWTLTVTKFDTASITELIVVGDAAPMGWNRGEAPAMTKEGDGVFKWTGELTQKGNADLKFLLGRDTWNSVCAVKPDNNKINGDPMPLQINYDGWPNDTKWEISATDSYKVTVNLARGTVEIVPKTSGVEGIEADEAEAVYYNLNGVRVDNVTSGIFVKVVNGKAVKVLK